MANIEKVSYNEESPHVIGSFYHTLSYVCCL